MNHPSDLVLRWLPRLALVLVLGMAWQARAQGAPEGAPEFMAATQRWLETAASSALPANAPLRLEVSVGALDQRLKLAPCNKVEPFVPTGTRLWGRSRLGLRCAEGSTRWSVFLPVTVKAWGKAWVTRSNLVTGATLSAADAMETEVDWAEDNSPVLTDASQWIGQAVARPLNAGQTLRQSTVRPAQVFGAGAQVRVLAQGRGFQVATEGQAITAGVIGQPARVRMDNGHVASGVVLDPRTIRLDL